MSDRGRVCLPELCTQSDLFASLGLCFALRHHTNTAPFRVLRRLRRLRQAGRGQQRSIREEGFRVQGGRGTHRIVTAQRKSGSQKTWNLHARDKVLVKAETAFEAANIFETVLQVRAHHHSGTQDSR